MIGMEGSRMPIAIAHGEGHAEFADTADKTAVNANAQVALRYVDNYGQVTEAYPANPNGSVDGITGLTAAGGRVTIMMPHPERVSVLFKTLGSQISGVKMALGCVCSAMRVLGVNNTETIWSLN